MKNNLILLLTVTIFAACSLKANAQNIQLHYDFGRNCATTTVEMFRPDKGGSTYFFVDMDYNPKVTGAYWEIAREICFWQETNMGWLSAHLEYNGGLNTSAGSFNNAFVVGATYSGNSEDWSKTWSLTAGYRVIPGTIGLNGKKQPHSFLITGVWNLDFFNHWLSFNGFIDFWREPRPWQGTNFQMVSEPQLWVNLNKIKGWEAVHLSLGTEVELSYNFAGKGFFALPTIGAKWTF